MHKHSVGLASAIGIALISAITLSGGSPALGAPGERGCIEAEGRLDIALVSRNMTAQDLDLLRISFFSVAEAREDYFAVSAETAAEEQDAVDSARTERDHTSMVVTTKQFELTQAQDAGDEHAIATAIDQLALATDSLATAEKLILEAQAAYDRAIDVPQVHAAKEKWDSSQAAHETNLASSGIGEADLFGFLQGMTDVLISCDPSNITEPPVVPTPIPQAPTDLPAGPEDQSDPSPPTTGRAGPSNAEPDPSEKPRVVLPAVNPGLNIQTNLVSSKG